jgi:hypothetical protein
VIVRSAPEHLHLITQPDHAHLAATIIEACVSLTAEPRRDAILLSVAEHDNGWAEEDAAPIINPATGHVADFVNAPLAVRYRVWPRAIRRLHQHPWSAALVAEHAIVVYDRFRSEPGWPPFFSEMENAREALVGASGLSLDELVGDYQFLRLADLISLAFCMDSTQEHHFAEWTVRLSGIRVIVTPDPFGGLTIPIEVGATRIRNQRFRDDAELRQAVIGAPSVVLRGEVAGSG